MALEPVKSDDGGSEVVAGAELLRPSNPMLIDVVIDNMFGYCDFETLGRCRQVSKQWFKVSLPHWLKQGPKLKLLLDDDDDGNGNPNEPFRQHRKNNGFNYMPEFLQLVSLSSGEYYESCGLRQYKKFEVEAGGYHKNGRRQEYLADFLRECGGRITELKLSVISVDLETYQNVMLSRMTPNLVKLEAKIRFAGEPDIESWAYELEQEAHEKLTTLQINIYAWTWERGYLMLPELLWIQLLKRYPNLKTLVNGVTNPSTAEDVDRMLETVWAIRQVDRKLLDLKRLEVCCGARGDDYDLESLLPLVQDTQLALETFRFSIGELTPDQTIYDVLESQASSVKILILHNHRDGPLENLQPPNMTSVTALKLNGLRLFPNLLFLKSFPSLESLVFNFAADANDDLENGADEFALVLNGTNEEFLEGLMSPALSKLHVNYRNVMGVLFPDDTRKLHRIMPNLTDVQLWLSNECFRAVCGCWPSLKSLCIIGNRVNNEGIMGRVALDGNMLPNVRNLTELESFSMKHFGYYNDVNEDAYHLPTAITGDAVNVLLHLPKLTRLEIALDEEHERKLGYLKNTPVIRVAGREIDVNIRFEAPLEEEFDDEDQVDHDGDSSGEEEGENNQDEGVGDDNERDADDERDGGEGVMEEGERDDDDGESQDADGVDDDGAESNQHNCAFESNIT